jgi:hypothetical protein
MFQNYRKNRYYFRTIEREVSQEKMCRWKYFHVYHEVLLMIGDVVPDLVF